MSTSVKRACDACHRRKVKCDGINPCRNCSSAQLSCTYNAIPQKKGPKGSRAKVISELRETQRQSSLSSKVTSRMTGVCPVTYNASLAQTPGLLTNDLIRECVDFFFTNMYPTLPILHRGRLEQQILYAEKNVDTYCLLTSLCAFMMIQPGMGIPGAPLRAENLPDANLVSGNLLMQETLRIRKSYDYLEVPTLNSLATSFFLFGCYFGLNLHNNAWFHLREATTLAHVNGLQKEETYSQFDVADASRRRRLYWLLFVTERAYALQRHRPLSLQATISPPSQNDDPTDPQACHLNGFIDLVSLFLPFDEALVTLWNKTSTECSPNYLVALQKDLADALPAYLSSNENQTADLRTSQQWLRTMVWQLSMQNGCLSSAHEEPSMTFQYPVDISRDLISMTSQFSHQSMDIHGIGLIEKLFDIACSLTDILTLLPPNLYSFTLGPQDYLHDFIGLLAVLRHGNHRFLPLLLAKVNDVLPRLVNPMLRAVPDPPPDVCNEIDVFDGYDTAGGSITMASRFPEYAGDVNSGSPDFKIEPGDYEGTNVGHGLPAFEQQSMDELGSPVSSSLGGTSSSSEHGAPSYSVDVRSPVEYSYSLQEVGSRSSSYVDELPGSKSEYNRAVETFKRPVLRSCSGSPTIGANTGSSGGNSVSSGSSGSCATACAINTGPSAATPTVAGGNGPVSSGFAMQIPRSVPKQVYPMARSLSSTCGGEASLR
ncbi:unnamed protein product [Blumeria hordei]|uniref:Zn(2)-C6 fungal-type domain-containing protein n=2 Tax=Blumeria hordei TaxID=2867405 RepID=A0A383UWR9_BLUHO|nr:hypothetical protein BGHDH14_bgh05094 [Blumeria hordei DH14]SZF04367.1 unnamed protein product [Blumeria hordei]